MLCISRVFFCRNLGENAIRSVQFDAFVKMKNLKELRISSDSFLCDCQLKWLPPWLLGRMLQAFVTATCAHPESLKGQSIFSVPSESFVCGKIIFLIFFFPHEKQGGALHYGSDSYDQS